MSVPQKDKLTVLTLGGGGREAALVRRFAACDSCGAQYAAPGNDSTALFAGNISLDINDGEAVAVVCRLLAVDFLMIGPEAPLAAGVADTVRRLCPDTAVLGPGADGARLESSKAFAKAFMRRHGIPTAPATVVKADNIAEAKDLFARCEWPIVLKADGLCGGKGSIIVRDRKEAEQTLRRMLGGQFGDASRTVVIEDFLRGRECSVFVVTDGANHLVLPAARDYKRACDGDRGPNTGGMGAVSPVPGLTAEFLEKVEQRITLPTLAGLRAEGVAYRGILYLGLISVGGEPYVLEYNVRLGDPETAVVLPRTGGDVLRAFYDAACGRMESAYLPPSNDAAVAVIRAAEGYPGPVRNGLPVVVGALPQDAYVLLGGAVTGQDGALLTAAGRVATAVAVAPDIATAAARAARAAEAVAFAGAHNRTDIGR